MFEKSLYDLIRGLRAHKGNEKNYIQQSLQECRNEAKSQDMDLKTAAVLKLIYLEMFGNPMTWASFHILEVMSSPKFVQKRVGYLAAVQSFRLDTDVLMLATNLLKKDLSSPNAYELSLAINGLSHIVSPSLARDLTPDLIAKMNHSNPYIRKKAVLVMYKIFLQFPEALRTSFPRLRERLEDSDGSVVSATVNVVCELARKNPKNYLPLAPQLFKLLTTSTNNWMTIKIIKLFATLTPLEPRLMKKLIPPITDIIKTTTAMSLLYECINGLISGGLLSQISDTTEGENLAVLCVNKLRGFLVEGDSNLKYVGLLALTKLVKSHAHLVQQEKDVILECIDDIDVSIRLRALELVVGMVDMDTLQVVVGRLIKQLRPITAEELEEMEREKDNDLEDPEEELTIQPRKSTSQIPLHLPEDYKEGVIRRILEMCSQGTYANIPDFEWYIDVLVQLVRFCPSTESKTKLGLDESFGDDEDDEDEAAILGIDDVSEEIGKELRNVAVRVRSVRREATEAAEMLVGRSSGMFPAVGGGGKRVLLAAGWIVGEFAEHLSNPNETLSSLLQSSNATLPPDILSTYVQSIPKVYATLTSNPSVAWESTRKHVVSAHTDRIVSFLEPLASSPHLEVQERSVEFLELFRLTREAITQQPVPPLQRNVDDVDDETTYEPPLILTQAIPSLFKGMELNPVAPKAQRKVPVPATLDLDASINPNFEFLLSSAEFDTDVDETADEDFHKFYYQKPIPIPVVVETASSRLDRAASSASAASGSYQTGENAYLDPDIIARRKAERRERNKDDPFYINNGSASGMNSGRATPNPLRDETVDIDSIPIMQLDLSGDGIQPLVTSSTGVATERWERAKVEIVEDEIGDDLAGSDRSDNDMSKQPLKKGKKKKGKQSAGIIGIDASNLVGFSLEGDSDGPEETLAHHEDVKKARREVERLRGEMQRAAKSVQAKANENLMLEPDSTAQKTKKKVKDATDDVSEVMPGLDDQKKKKKKKKKGADDGTGEEKAKKKKVRKTKPVNAAPPEDA